MEHSECMGGGRGAKSYQGSNPEEEPEEANPT
jgi:hypothetical protein